MLRALFIVYPFLAAYVAIGALVFVPLTWIIRDIRPLYWVSRQGVRLGLALSGVHFPFVRSIHPFLSLSPWTTRHRLTVG